MVNSIGLPGAELRLTDPNNPSQGPHPTNGYLKNLSEMHRYHKWVPKSVEVFPMSGESTVLLTPFVRCHLVQKSSENG